MPTLVKPKKTRKPQTFTITFRIGEDTYHVFPLHPHPEVASHAYRLKKLTGDRPTHDVHLDTEGYVHCDCPGFVYHRKPCRHLRALVAAGMLPRSILEPARNSNVPCEF